MTLYPRRDYQAIGPVPGCDTEHKRPVDRSGRPVHPWGIDCPAHQAYYSGAAKPKILKYITDPKTGAVVNQQRVPDAHPGFSTSPDTIPMTPDEERSRERKLEMGENQLRALEALLTLKGGGIDLTSRPEVMFFLQESGLSAEMLQGKVVCPSGHDNPAGNAFCGTCAAPMHGQKAIASEPAANLSELHVATLRKTVPRPGPARQGRQGRA